MQHIKEGRRSSWIAIMMAWVGGRGRREIWKRMMRGGTFLWWGGVIIVRRKCPPMEHSFIRVHMILISKRKVPYPTPIRLGGHCKWQHYLNVNYFTTYLAASLMVLIAFLLVFKCCLSFFNSFSVSTFPCSWNSCTHRTYSYLLVSCNGKAS